jgi:hypothetical protein
MNFFSKKQPFTPVTNTQQKHDNHRTQVNQTELTRSFIINEIFQRVCFSESSNNQRTQVERIELNGYFIINDSIWIC